MGKLNRKIRNECPSASFIPLEGGGRKKWHEQKMCPKLQTQTSKGQLKASGTRHQTPGTRHQAPDTRHQTPGTRHQAPLNIHYAFTTQKIKI